MIILGISFLSDASACILKNGKIISAISEERINRKKLFYGIPTESINKVLKLSKININEVDYIATHCKIKNIDRSKYFLKIIKKINDSNISDKIKRKKIVFLKKRLKHENFVINKRTPSYLEKLKKFNLPILNFEHHECHASSAYYGSTFKNSLIITADGWGEDGSASIWNGINGNMHLIKKTKTIDSLGYFYGSVTKALGFIPHRHEGKVLGLAAYSKLQEPIKEISEMIYYDKSKKVFKGNFVNSNYLTDFHNPYLSKIVKKYKREDIAYSTQKTLEKCLIDLVESFNNKKINISLAGGIFANVVVNQKILETKNVNEIYVFPNMGDGGLSVGAAYLAFNKLKNKRPKPFKSCLIGPQIDNIDLKNKIEKFKFKYRKLTKNPEKFIAIKLAQKKVIALVSGNMEFGPRALCNRSIIASAEDKNINNTLNKKLGRSEFMPFAPVSLKKYKEKLYFTKGRSNKYNLMTITVKCKRDMINLSPAAVHLDNTARPQLVDKKNYPIINNILTEYYKITKIPTLINTSYNMHEEPIVCDADDALRAFKDSKLDYLYINNFLVYKK